MVQFLSTLSLRRATACPLWTTASPRFLSTLSLRRATHRNKLNRNHRTDFYPRSPCGERLRPIDVPQYHILISIHALLAESDDVWAAAPSRAGPISIHALLAESDIPRGAYQLRYAISIHALLAESDSNFSFIAASRFSFLSTLSLRRATGDAFYLDLVSGISIHALLAESDARCLYFSR